MKGLILSTILSSVLSSHGVHQAPHSLTQPPTLPEKCPSISAMASQGLDHVSPFLLLVTRGAWMGVKENSNYDTNDQWTFLMFETNGVSNGKAAIQQLSADIKTLNIISGPDWDEQSQMAVCVYMNNSNPDSSIVGLSLMPAYYS